MSYYSETPLSEESMSRMTGGRCIGYGAGASHAGIIQRAGGEIGYDGFRDPRPGQSGSMVASKVFINQNDQTIQGINFSKNGTFCCSYTGMDYADIRDSNQRDCAAKAESTDRSTESKTLQRQRSARPEKPVIKAQSMQEGNSRSQVLKRKH